MRDDDRHDPEISRASAVTVDVDSVPAAGRASGATLGRDVRIEPPLLGAARYERGEEIGRGGLGRVTAALDRTLQRQVAIKELHERTERSVERFVREGLTTARLQHPAIVPVLDAGTWDGGDPYLVMKLLEGKTLAEELAARTSTEARLALLPSLLAVADALAFAHEHGVVHRDVKPANIMLGMHGETVLLDWGVAHDSHASGGEPPPAAGAVVGTPRYMSPEQVRGEPPDPGFDVYSLGVTLAAVLPADVPPDLAAIVAKATAPDAAARYPHAGGLADDLRKFISGQLVGARRYSRRQLLLRWLRRHRVVLAVGVAATAAVAVAGTIAVRSVIGERDVANARRADAEARERELVLQQARANVRTDPTATVAWLAGYPADAPHQAEVLALLDEAEGRGVARHVWHDASWPADAVFTGDGHALVLAHRDGELARADIATGVQTSLVHADTPLVFARVLGAAVFALDQDGHLYRSDAAGGTRAGSVAVPSPPSGLFRVGDTGALKVTFVDDEAAYVAAGAAPVPHVPHASDVSDQVGEHTFSEDENNANAVYVTAATGALSILDPSPRALWQFGERTWVRSSDDGTHYLALEPAADSVAVWLGTARGAPPVNVGTLPACRAGDDQGRDSDIANDGSVAVIVRCGVVHVLDLTGAGPASPAREVTIRDPDRIDSFNLSDDSRWLALGRRTGLELVDLRSGASRALEAGSKISLAGFAPTGDWVFSLGVEQGLRLWPVVRDARAAALGPVATPTRLGPSTRPGELAIRHHLGCATWSLAERRVIATSALPPARLRLLDDDDELWAWDASDDGRACVFAAPDGGAVVLGAEGDVQTLVDPGHPLLACVLSGAGDHVRATCTTTDDQLVTFDAATGARLEAAHASGSVRGLVHYRGAPVVLVRAAGGCTLERPGGEVLGRLPGGPDCRDPRVAGVVAPDRDAAIVVARPAAVDVWTPAGLLTVPTEAHLVEVSLARNLVAVARDQAIEIRDLRTRTRVPGPPPHTRAITRLAWASTGVLASADDETIRLWDPATGRTRVLYAPAVVSLVWAPDGRTLYTTDGRLIEAWPIDLDAGATPAEVRERIERLTTARIVDGVVATPR